jgi:hypothetical protein
MNEVVMTQTAVPTPVRRAVRRPAASRYALLGIVLVTCAVLVTGYLTIALWRQVDPVTTPVSEYVYYRPGGVLFVLSVLLLLFGGLALLAGMTGVRMPRDRGVRVLFGLWCAGLVLCAVFRANQVVGNPTVSGEIHRVGGAMFLACLPLAGMRLARTLVLDPRWTLTAGQVRGFATAAMATAAAFGVSQVATWLPLGLLERFALGAEVALLVVLALAVRRVAR